MAGFSYLKSMLDRRSFLHTSVVLVGGSMLGSFCSVSKAEEIITVNGPIAAELMGLTLIHEHILVDFIGAEKYDPKRWVHQEVISKVLPYLQELEETGCRTIIDCTPNYLGRDVLLLQKISSLSGLNIITNTGYYGGSDNKYLPPQAFIETDLQLADRWIKEFNDGIDGTKIKPGFIKISVNSSRLSDISKKLISSAAHCHLKTGLSIASHTGPATPAFQQIEILKQLDVAASAFIWVHAQNEKDWNQFIKAAKLGAWVSLDGLSDNNVSQYVQMLAFVKKEKQLHRVLVSHDAGWYDPEKPGGGSIRGYTTLFSKLVPALNKAGFGEADINQLLKYNPIKAFSIDIRKR
jgi:phosphotriesterase-related protein